jgi:hypothetical protein
MNHSIEMELHFYLGEIFLIFMVKIMVLLQNRLLIVFSSIGCFAIILSIILLI